MKGGVDIILICKGQWSPKRADNGVSLAMAVKDRLAGLIAVESVVVPSTSDSSLELLDGRYGQELKVDPEGL